VEFKIDVSLQTNYHALIIVHHNVAAELILKCLLNVLLGYFSDSSIKMPSTLILIRYQKCTGKGKMWVHQSKGVTGLILSTSPHFSIYAFKT